MSKITQNTNVKKMVIGSEEWQNLLRELVYNNCPPMTICRHCQAPILTGYVCQHCGDTDPATEPIEPRDYLV